MLTGLLGSLFLTKQATYGTAYGGKIIPEFRPPTSGADATCMENIWPLGWSGYAVAWLFPSAFTEIIDMDSTPKSNRMLKVLG